MKSLADKYADELVMLVGKDEIKNIAKSYGLNKTMTATELHEQVPDLFPDAQTTAAAHNPDFHEPVKAILVFLDPHHYHRDIQLCVDVLRSNGIVGTTHDGEQQVPIYFSCWDFEYVTEWPVPRFGAGIFAMTVDALYEQSTGHKLTKTVFGKPLRSTYEYAEQMLGVDHVYGVGDNPLSDIKGANEAGDNWSSVLVETGMFVPEQHADANGNHPEHPGDHVHPNVYDAIQAIVKQRTGQ
jgi:HAD superfamily hydrolase (TIGR01456 family)